MRFTKPIIGLTLGGAIFASAFGSAAGLTNVSMKLGGSSAVVASCDTDGIASTYTTGYDPTLAAYKVTGVNVTAINALCAGATMRITLSTAAGAQLGDEMSTAVTAATFESVAYAGSAINAALVEKVNVVIVGP